MLIRPIKQTKTANGLYLPDNADQPPLGVAVSVGPGMVVPEASGAGIVRENAPCCVGDVIAVAHVETALKEPDGDDVFVIRFPDVIAIVDPGEARKLLEAWEGLLRKACDPKASIVTPQERPTREISPRPVLHRIR